MNKDWREDYKIKSINFLIDQGGIITDKNIISYYCSTLNIDWEKTKEFSDKIKEFGIDYEKSDNLQEDSVSIFDGTFNDPAQVPLLYSIIVLNNGDRSRWYSEGNLGVETLAEYFLSEDKTLDRVLQHLEERYESHVKYRM
jgi:hypothetical protein